MARNTQGNDNRDFDNNRDESQRDMTSSGGQGQGKESNPGNFANDRERAAEAGRRGGLASHGNRGNQEDDDGY